MVARRRIPTWKTIADIGKTSTKVLYFQGASYMDYLIGKGILKKSQVDGSPTTGRPTNFVASGGQDAVQGFATAEPYIWSHDVRAWDKPLKYQLIADAGFNFYQQAIGVRKDKLAALTPCLKKLVPIMQQAIVDYVANPAPTDDADPPAGHRLQQRLGLHPGHRGLRGGDDEAASASSATPPTARSARSPTPGCSS